jgi:hypothetical protein
MTLILNGTTGLSDVDGTAAAPAIRGTDADTGLYFPAANEVAAAAGGSSIWNAASSFGFKNRFINGDMRINQRSVTSVAAGTEAYTLDRWVVANYFSSGAISVAQSSDAPTGFTNSILVTNGTGEALASSDFGSIRQKIEGFNLADLAWGTASAQPVRISFWAKSSVTGNYNVTLINNAMNRSNRTVFTINAANTWEYKTVSFAGDTSGTWVTNNGIGVYFDIVLVAGSSQYGTADTWTANALEGVSGASATWVTSTNATFYVTGAQFEKGSTATSFDFRDFGTELMLCQRYYEISNAVYTLGGNVLTMFSFRTTKRSQPTVALSSGSLSGGGYTGTDAFRCFGNGVDLNWTASSEI